MHVLADARGRPLHAVLGAGQQHDCTRALELLQAVRATGNVLADNAYDTNQVLAAVAALGAEPVIPSQPRRRTARPVDVVWYRQRNRIERLMSRLKQFRRLATRYDKTASSYLRFLHFVCALLWLR
ncbi:Transposase [Hymenobacter psychrotolerans DSM 18569]|uniref:Transposase n=1 Tax=Hymenobacter psychrotolerans DSM 18569 TaxID=1121959 RepID=A0A1M6ZD57_9BACT|nr:Transposase [Hymenobacter psychrotolerans DSM 18569]